MEGGYGLTATTPDSGICLIAKRMPKIQAEADCFELILVGRPSSQ
jgi:hypothetical protein